MADDGDEAEREGSLRNGTIVTHGDPLPEGPEKARAVRSMFDRIAPRYDLVNRIMTFGMDVAWRRRAVESLCLPPSSLVLDLACGTGDLCRELDKHGHRAVGLDVSIGMLTVAKTEAPLVQGDALFLPFGDKSIDGITCGFALRNVTDLTKTFAEMRRVLRIRGRLAMLEVAKPESPWMQRGHSLYFNKVVPRIGGLLSDRDAYNYLPRSASYLPDRERLLDMLGKLGFPDARSESLSFGAAQLITGTRES